MPNIPQICATCAHLIRRDNRCPVIARYVRLAQCACEGKHYRPNNSDVHWTQPSRHEDHA